eukprot:6289713-Ditylum_brightwellii.AAC.1
MAIEVGDTTALPISPAREQKLSEDETKATTHESSDDNAVQVQASPPIWDSSREPSVDATI